MTMGWVTASHSPGVSNAASQAATRWHSCAKDSPPCGALAGLSNHSDNACGFCACNCLSDSPCHCPKSQSANAGSTRACVCADNQAAVSQARRSGAVSTCTAGPIASGGCASARMLSSALGMQPVFWAWVMAWQTRVRRMAFTGALFMAGGADWFSMPGAFLLQQVAPPRRSATLNSPLRGSLLCG